MSQFGDALLHYYDYFMPGTYLYPMEMTTMTPLFNAYIPCLDYMSSFTNTITYVTSPFGMTLSSSDNLTHPQTTFYELHEDDNVDDDYVVEYQNGQLEDDNSVQKTTPKGNCLEREDIYVDNSEQQQESIPKRTEETMKNTADPEPNNNRIYRTEQGYLVEEPSSEPSEEG